MNKIVVVGKGAIGLLWAYHIKQLNDVSVALYTKASDQAHSNRLHNTFSSRFAISHRGGLSSEFELQRADKDSLAQADILIVCLKSYDMANCVNQLYPMLAKHCAIILSHNGMGCFEQLNPKISDTHAIYGLLTTHGSRRSTVHHVIHTGIGTSDLGLLTSPKIESALVQQPVSGKTIATLLNRALPHVSWQDNFAEKQWLKLAVNCVINPLTAINNVDNGALCEPSFAQVIKDICKEVVAVANAEGLSLTEDELVSQVNRVASNTANNISSMRSDILHQRVTEIDYINGYICQLAQKYQISAPYNARLVMQVKTLENSYNN